MSRVVAYAMSKVGGPYFFGATGPVSFDCSGLVLKAFATAGISLPRTSQEQSTRGTSVSLIALRPGDVLFWGSPGAAFHDAIYIGNGQYIAAENPVVGIAILSFDWDRPDFARRIA